MSRIRPFGAFGSLLLGILLGAFGTWAAIATGRVYTSVILPNGLVVKRVFDRGTYMRDDMFARDGRTRLARDLEFLCFDDHHLWVTAHREGTGLYDGETGRKIADSKLGSGLWAKGMSCNGYYTGMTGAYAFYPHGSGFPPCAWRNLDNPALRRRDWLSRPCQPWPD